MSNKKKTFSIATLGCKLNQYESECIRNSLEKNDWIYKPFESGADFYIINTCTVTGKTDSRCRNAIRRAKRISPQSTVVVTGCYAETQPEKLREMPEIDILLGNSEKQSTAVVLNRMVEEGTTANSYNTKAVSGNDVFKMSIDNFHDHSRAFIKIQEGCNSACSYCIIPRARGPSRSVGADTVLKQARILESNGYREIVLTGIHIGRYGMDLDEDMDLAKLVKMLIGATSHTRIRLSSIELTEVKDNLLSLISESTRLTKHIHVPLQSGDDEILYAMNRPYRSSEFAGRIEEISHSIGNISIGTDIIVGFPGETEERFGNTYNLVRGLPLSYLHVFSYSRRPGTAAASMPNQISPMVKKTRSKKLIKLGKSKKFDFLKSQVGRDELAVVQGPKRPSSQFSRTLTGNYCEVFVKSPPGLKGYLMPITISHYSRGRLYGILMDTVR